MFSLLAASFSNTVNTMEGNGFVPHEARQKEKEGERDTETKREGKRETDRQRPLSGYNTNYPLKLINNFILLKNK